MGKSINTIILDQALNYIANNVTRMDLCTTSEPTNYTQATSTNSLGNVTGLTSANFTGPAAGDTNGRKITVDAQTGISTSAGTCGHVALTDGVSTLLLVTTTGNESLAASGTADVAAFDYEIADPT